MKEEKTVLVLIDTQSLMCKRYSGRTMVLKVQATSPLLPYEVEMIRSHPENIPSPPEDSAA